MMIAMVMIMKKEMTKMTKDDMMMMLMMLIILAIMMLRIPLRMLKMLSAPQNDAIYYDGAT